MSKVANRYCPRCFEAYTPDVEVCPEHKLPVVRLRGGGDELAGSVVDDKYEIVDTLGSGGMGTVYRARQLPIGREVALKVLRRDYLEDHKGVARFVREARAASLLKSRYSAMLHDFGLAPEGFLYYTMELASGRLLSDIVDRDGALGVERTLHLAADICNSLAEAHANNIVHRDIKADNIMVSEDADGHEIAKVLDFGTAKLVDTLENSTRVTDPGIVCGTPEYMSPEQAQALPVDGRSDLYSLGVLMFEMLTGKLPFTAKTNIAVLMMHVNDPVPTPEQFAPDIEVGEGLDALLSRLLAKRPEDRPKSAVVVLRDLQGLLEEFTEQPAGREALKSHASFTLEQSVEEAYRAPRGNTLIELMDSPALRQATAGEGATPKHTMELQTPDLWRDDTPESEPISPIKPRDPTGDPLDLVDTLQKDPAADTIAAPDPIETPVDEFVEPPREPTPPPSMGPGPSAPVRKPAPTPPPQSRRDLSLEAGLEEGIEQLPLKALEFGGGSPDSIVPTSTGAQKLKVLPEDVLKGMDAAVGKMGARPSGRRWVWALIGGIVVGGGILVALFQWGGLGEMLQGLATDDAATTEEAPESDGGSATTSGAVDAPPQTADPGTSAQPPKETAPRPDHVPSKEPTMPVRAVPVPSSSDSGQLFKGTSDPEKLPLDLPSNVKTVDTIPPEPTNEVASPPADSVPREPTAVKTKAEPPVEPAAVKAEPPEDVAQETDTPPDTEAPEATGDTQGTATAEPAVKTPRKARRKTERRKKEKSKKAEQFKEFTLDDL